MVEDEQMFVYFLRRKQKKNTEINKCYNLEKYSTNKANKLTHSINQMNTFRFIEKKRISQKVERNFTMEIT